MNRLFKKVVSSVLAAAMMVGSVTVANVSSVFAADTTTEWNFSKNTAGTLTVGGTIADTKSTSNAIVKGTAEKVILDSSDLNIKADGALWLPIKSTTKKVVLEDYSVNKDSNRYVLVGKKQSTTNKLANIAKNTSYSVELNDLTDELESDGNGNLYLPIISYGNYKTQYFKLTESGEAETTYSVSGAVTVSDNADLTGNTFDVMSGTTKKATATISGSSYTLDAKLVNGTYTFVSTNGLYTASGEVTVNGADVSNADVTFTAKTKYEVSGAITGATVADGTTFTLTNKDYSDVTATATVSGSNYTVTAIAGTYTISGLEVENMNISTTEVEISETSATDIAFASASKMTKSFDFSFSEAVTSGQDLSNGVYAVDAMTYSTDGSFTTRTGYVSNDTNPADADGTTGGSIKYPVKGAALKFVAGVDGTVIVDYYVGGAKTLYFKSVDSDGNVSTVSSVKTEGAGTGSYSEKVEAGKEYYFFGQGTKLRYYGVKFVADVKVTFGGTVTADGVTMPEKLIFTEQGTTNSTEATIGTDGTYSVTLVNGKSYDVTCSDGTLMATVGDTITVEESTTTHNVTIATASAEAVTGEVVGLADPTKATITFTKGGKETTVTADSTGKYTVDLLPGTYSVAVSSVDGYTASSLSTADFTVKQSSDSTAENWKNVLYTKTATAVTSEDVYVGYSDKDNNFATITEAMDAINVSKQSKYVVHIAPGTYTEQVIVKANNVTFTDDNKGGVTISWYYGIDYSYYSCNNGYYDKAYAVDKHAKGTPDRWGCTVRVTGNNFYAEGITFENTFNRKQTTEEIADGVTSLGKQGNTTADRTATDFAPKAAASTERAAALVLDNNQSEIYNCKMLSSQDTLYVNKGVYYFNGCTIQGETDYIFGDSSKAVFDDCTLVWAGYSTGAKEGYITAARGSMLFRNCTISNSNDLGNTVVAGYLGRHWGDSAKVIFADTKGMSTSTLVASSASGQSAYFADPSGLTKTAASVVTEAYVTTDTDYSNGQKYAEATEITEQKVTNSTTLKATDVAGATYLGSWTPEDYAFEEAETDENETSDRVTVTWDFKNNTPESLSTQTIQGATADLDSNGYTLHVDATSGKLYIRTGDWAQFNKDTILQVPVNAVGDVVSVANYDTSYTVAGVAATAKDTTYTATEEDVTKGYVEVVASANSYIGSVSVEITPKQVVTKTTATWDFKNNSPENLSTQTIQKATADLDSNGYTLHVDATSGKLYIRTGDWAQFNKDTILQVPVYTVGDTVSVANYDTNYTVAGVAATDKDTTYTATEADVAKGYVEVVASANSYIGSITLVTTGTPSTSTTETTNYIKGVGADKSGTAVAYLYATVTDVENIDEVGFIIAPKAYTDATEMAKDANCLTSSTKTVYDAVSFGETTVEASQLNGSYIFGTAVTGLQSGDTVYYAAYAKTADGTYYDAINKIAMSE